MESGLEWLRRTPAIYDISIHGIMAKGFAGYQLTVFDHLIADIYIGFGMRYAIEDKPKGSNLKFNYGVNYYAYKGMLWVAGLCAGIGL
jgi:hypothetical protein